MKTAGKERGTAVQPAARPAKGRWWSVTKIALSVLVLAGLIAAAAALLSPTPNPDKLWAEAQEAVASGRLDRAEANLSKIRRIREPLPQDQMLAAQIDLALARNDDAIKALGEIPEDHPLRAQAWYMIGRIERERNRIHRAEVAYRNAVKLNPSMVPAHRELIYIYGMLLRRPELEAEYNALSRLTPLNHRDLFTRGFTHFNTWGPESAEHLETFIAADPDDRTSRLALADMLINQPGARAKIEEILAPLGPNDLDATALLIELKLSGGETDQAVALLDSTKGRNTRLSRLRGRVALLKGDPKSAVTHFQDALNDQPYDRAALAELAKAMTIKGDSKAAEAVMNRVRKLNEVYNLINRISRPGRENSPSDLTALAHALEAAGLMDEAQCWYQLAIARDPLDADSQQALQRIRNHSAQ